jgi:hypothetical protein
MLLTETKVEPETGRCSYIPQQPLNYQYEKRNENTSTLVSLCCLRTAGFPAAAVS